ncbi:hypothetical protein VTL71DRAFT_12108 [Oculimacula yallundae]|uniref:Phosphoglycerate mutase family protein n=1 Tax=Oculimacula yallundae TaxID=86028 RepID=A0ABR4CS25_9HELO
MDSNSSNVNDKGSISVNNDLLSLDFTDINKKTSSTSTSSSRDQDLENNSAHKAQAKKPEQQDEMLSAMYKVISSAMPPLTFGAAILPPGETPRPPPKITIHLVRHAEGPHNLRSIPEPERVAMLDPGLTTWGHSQSVLLSKRFHAMDKVTHILCSPMRRTVHTALVGLKPAIQRGIQVTLIPDLREYGGGRCNMGSNLEDLVKDVLDIDKDIRKDCFDRSQCPDYWFLDSGVRESNDQKMDRIGRVQSMLYSLANTAAEASSEDIEIVVVTHSRIILLLEERHKKEDGKFTTDEEFTAGANAFALVETEESKRYTHTFPDDPEDDDKNGL